MERLKDAQANTQMVQKTAAITKQRYRCVISSVCHQFSVEVKMWMRN